MKVLIFGTFDGLHDGHKFFISEALKRGDLFIVVARDNNVKFIKNKETKFSENERLNVIEKEFPEVDVRLGDTEDFMKPVKDIAPDLILFGYDQKLPPGIGVSDLKFSTERVGFFDREE
ncbi:adenylyltransferase/cytidyltransferase family protein [Candidatus Peribacteria bacterium]|jgi:FAD synthetase|nr:adenylyltransferase/cytidyltransferase family protein [Candidatus Peribacteria bacterium]MBT4021442.1 adenylyltransferase/cytidyltransferase family protein [Candidatus Peribacteria bacterium]MBT4240458.1 adenylyltransferase/cytidyltransferase family protein [Candidatus Peribacteria bacterium]MBT4474540.1 adenylyltransferase/cytidyltransferase family protein [Candidatus Peribacteria bacterium]